MVRSRRGNGFGSEQAVMMAAAVLATLGVPFVALRYLLNDDSVEIGYWLSWASPFIVVGVSAWALFGRRSERPWNYWASLALVALGGFAGLTSKALTLHAIEYVFVR